MFTKFILNCDIFGYLPSFNINKNRNFKTYFGSLVSMLVVTMILVSIWQFGREIIYKLTPNVIEYYYYDQNQEGLNLTNENFILGFNIYSESNLTVSEKALLNNDYSFLDISASYNIPDNNSINKTFSHHNSRKIEMVKCSTLPLLIETQNFPRRIISSDCLNLKNEDNFQLKNINSEIANFISIEISGCKNETIKTRDRDISACKSDEEINKLFLNLRFSLFIYLPLINPSDYTNPYIFRLIEIKEILVPQIFKEIDLNFANVKIHSDVGWLMEDIQQINSFELNEKNIYLKGHENSENKILKTNLNLSFKTHFIKRLYIKIQTIAANLGGIIKFLLILGEVLVYYFAKIEFKEYLISIFFDDTKYIGNETNKNIVNSSNFNLTSKLFNSNTNQIFLKKKSLKPFTHRGLSSIKKLVDPSKSIVVQKDHSVRRLSTVKKEENISKLNTWQILKNSTCLQFDKLKSRLMYLDSFYEILSVNFDLIFTIKSQIEYELFKSVLLNKEQNDILTVTFRKKNEKKLNDTLFDEEFDLGKINLNIKEEIKNSYRKLLENKDIISKRIVEHFENNCRNFLNLTN